MKKYVVLIFLMSLISVLHGQSINEKLIAASARGNLEDLKLYLKSDSVNIDYKDKWGYTALDYAIERNQKLAFIELLHFYSKVKNCDTEFSSFLALMLNNRNPSDEEVIKFINMKHCTGYYPLSLAVRWCDYPIVMQFLDNGANPNQVNSNRYKTTPLMEASRHGNSDIVKLLIANGANINFPDINNDPALNWAVYFGQTEMVKILLENGARTDMVGKDSGDSALAIAKRMKFEEIIQLLETNQK